MFWQNIIVAWEPCPSSFWCLLFVLRHGEEGATFFFTAQIEPFLIFTARIQLYFSTSQLFWTKYHHCLSSTQGGGGEKFHQERSIIVDLIRGTPNSLSREYFFEFRVVNKRLSLSKGIKPRSVYIRIGPAARLPNKAHRPGRLTILECRFNKTTHHQGA